MFRGEVFIPIISIVLFLVFLCTDKESKFRKILYSSNVILWGITLFTGLIIEQLPVGYGAVYPNLAFLPLLWFGAFSVGVCTFLYGVPIFLLAKRKYLWAKIGLVLLALGVFAVIAWGLFMLFGALYVKDSFIETVFFIL